MRMLNVKLSSNELVIVSPGSTLLSFSLSVGLLSINDRTTEDREVTSGGKLVVASVKGGGGSTWTHVASTGEHGGQVEGSTVRQKLTKGGGKQAYHKQ